MATVAVFFVCAENQYTSKVQLKQKARVVPWNGQGEEIGDAPPGVDGVDAPSAGNLLRSGSAVPSFTWRQTIICFRQSSEGPSAVCSERSEVSDPDGPSAMLCSGREMCDSDPIQSALVVESEGTRGTCSELWHRPQAMQAIGTRPLSAPANRRADRRQARRAAARAEGRPRGDRGGGASQQRSTQRRLLYTCLVRWCNWLSRTTASTTLVAGRCVQALPA